MDLPADVQIHNEHLGAKGRSAKLVAISPHGYFELLLGVNGKTHRVMVPIQTTTIVFREPEEEFEEMEIER